MYIIYQFLPPCTFKYGRSCVQASNNQRLQGKSAENGLNRCSFPPVTPFSHIAIRTLLDAQYCCCIPGRNATMSSPNIQGAWSKSKHRTSPRCSPSPPLSSSLCVVLGRCTQGGGDKSMPIRALSFALNFARGPNAASKRRGANPSIASL